MKVLFIECNMGASGDMILSALSELADNQEKFMSELNNCGISGIMARAYRQQSCGIEGTNIDVKVNGLNCELLPHRYMRLHSVRKMISAMSVSADIKANITGIYEMLAKAKASFQNKDFEKVFLHEIARADSLTDITGICMLIEKLAPDKIVVSPVCTGYGKVTCLRGEIDVPAPMTEEILKDVPTYEGNIESELCTPTGAAILRYFADEFSEMPDMKVRKTGIGIGKKIFNTPNCVRVYMGYCGDQQITSPIETDEGEIVSELSANIDDMTPEMLSYAMDVLYENGALDVCTIPIHMKKNRSAVMLKCICEDEKALDFASIILKHTTTSGVRRSRVERFALGYSIGIRNTEYGEVRVKTYEGYGIEKQKIEYDDLAEIAKRTGKPIKQLSDELSRTLDLI